MSNVKMMSILWSLTLAATFLVKNAVSQGSYLGCFKETPGARVFTISAGTFDPDHLSPTSCMSACKKWMYRYAGMTEGRFCFCSKLAPTNPASPDSLCDETCSQPPGMCGGRSYISAYEADVTMTGLELSVVGQQDPVVKVGTVVYFDLTRLDGPSNVAYAVDFGDGSGLTPYNDSLMLERSYATPGEYIVTAQANNTAATKASVAVTVQAPVGYLDFYCPPEAAYMEEMRCNATVLAGTYLNLTIDYGDGISEVFAIADPYYFTAGPGVPHWAFTSTTAPPTTNVYIMPNSEFSNDGTVLSVEFYATITGGSITFLILSPSCGTYCYNTNRCGGTTCQPSCNNPTNLFCPRSQACVDPSTPAATAPCQVGSNRYLGTLSAYQIVQQTTVPVSKLGSQTYPLNPTVSPMTVKKGDIIGYIPSTGGQIATRGLWPDETSDLQASICSGLPCTPTVLSTTVAGTAARHLLRAIASKPAAVLFFHTYTNTERFPVKLEVKNDLLPTALHAFANQSVLVAIGINISIVIAPEFAATNQIVQILLAPHTGSNVTYLWTTGDGGELNTTTPYLNYTYTKRGCFFINNTAYNAISRKSSNTTMICIEDLLTNLTVANNISDASQTTIFFFSMISGSDFFCYWTFGDDGPVDRTDMYQTPITGSPWSHSYANDGAYPVNVTCFNNISTQTTEFIQYVEWPITNLRLLKNGTLANNPFTITYLIDKGTTPTFNFTFIGAAYSAPYTGATKSGTTVQLPSQLVGIYEVVVQGWNHISFVTLVVNFTAQLKIVNPKSVCDLTETVADAPVTYTATVDDGSNVNISWNFVDGTPVVDYVQPWGQAASSVFGGFREVRTHGFPRGGEFTVKVVICNDIDSYTFNHTIIVYGKIENVTLVNSGPVAFLNGKGDVKFNFESLTPPANVMVVFDYGNGQKSISQPFDMAKFYPFTYLTEGTYQVIANISHRMGWGTVATTVIVSVPIKNMDLITEDGKKHASLNVPFLIGAAMELGSGVNLEFDFGDGSPVISKPRLAKNPYDNDNATHTYTKEGTYLITVTAQNAIGNTTETYLVVVQRPVLPFFTLTSNSPVSFPTGLVQYTLTYPANETLPADASMQFFWGDGNFSFVMPLNFTTTPYVFSIPYTYQSPGNFIAQVAIKNLASNLTFTVENADTAGAYDAISSLAMTATYQPEPPPYGSALQPGFGETALTFPIDQDIVFTADVKGFVSMYQVLVTDMNGNVIQAVNETTNPFSLSCLRNMTSNGQYKVQIVAWNPLSNKTYEFIINVNKTISGASLTVNPTSGPSTTVFNFTTSFVDVGADTCVVLDFGDGTKGAYGKNQAYCAKVTTVPVLGPLTNPLVVTHKYPTTTKTYTATMSAYDPMANKSFAIDVVVSGLDCSLPVLDIYDRKPSFSDPLVWNRADQLDLTGNTNINCPQSLANNKSWTVDLISETTGEPVTRLANISTLQSSYSSLLSVPERFLGYGLYRFTYRVVVNKTIFASEVVTYVRIRPTPIIALLAANGMSFITRGFGGNLTISPQFYSYDPDLRKNENQTFDNFIWYCRQHDEQFPTYPNGTLLPISPSTVYTEAQLAALTGPTKGGCFRQGPGIIAFNGGSLTFSTKNMRANDTYVFRVTVVKDTRVSTGELKVDFIDGTPPSVEIGCIDKLLCTPLTKTVRINPTNRVSLYAQCTEYCADPIVYQWVIYRLGLNGAWLPIENFEQYVSGTASREVAINNQLFIDGFALYKNLLDYRVGVTVTTGSGSVAGSSYMELHLNTPPVGGSCVAAPLSGMAAISLYTISCQGWTDPDNIDVYLFYGVFPDDQTKVSQLGFSYNGQLGPILLPQGSPTNDSNLLLYARIFDTLGAFIQYNLTIVQVLPISEKAAEELVSQLLNNKTTTNVLERVIAGGNLADMGPTFLALADALNTATRFENQEYGNGSLTYPTALLLASDEYQTLRDEQAAMRGKMIQALNNVTLPDIASIQLLASTLSKVTQETTQINRVDQEAAVNTIGNMYDKMEEISESTPLEEFVLATTSIATTIGNLLQSINYAADDGTKADIEQSKDTVFYSYDTDYASPRKAFAGLPANEIQKGFLGETNNLAQKDSATETVRHLSSILSKLEDLLLTKLVAGETPLNISTPLLDLYMEKNEPSKVAGRPLTLRGATVTLPDWCEMAPPTINCSDQTPIAIKMSVTPENIFSYFKDNDVSPFSSTVTIDATDSSGKKIGIKGTRGPIEIRIPRNGMPPPVETVEASYMSTKDQDASLFYYKFNVTSKGASVHIRIIPEQTKNVQFIVFVRYKQFPKLNGTKQGWDFMQNLPKSMSNLSEYTDDGVDPYVVFVNNDIIKDREGLWFIGVRQLQPYEYDLYNDENTPAPPVPMTGRFNTNYTMLIYKSGCYYCRQGENAWSSDGCVVSPKTTVMQTVCLCSHLTSFGGGFAVSPNVIDFDFVLANSDFMKNPTIYITMIIIGVVYILLFIWARWQDKKDLVKLGVTPLPDNDPRDRYLYEVTVETGLRKNAGTESKVHIILSGDYDETDARTLEDDERNVLKRGSTDAFLMAVPRPLGPLNYARIWHDNTGKGKYASWYLNFMIIRDIQTGQKFHFIVNQWFAVEEDDGQISRLVPVCGREQMVETGHLFSQKTNKGFGDDHIWFSVVARPVTSRFTRIQRLSCCLCLLFTAMLANAMFYGIVGSTSTGGLSIGPFTITPEQIYVGIISNLIVFPVNFTIAFLFKKSRPRRKRPSRIGEALRKMLARQKNEDADAYVRRREAAQPSMPQNAWQPNLYNNDEKRDNRDWESDPRPQTARSVDLEEATASQTARLTEPPRPAKKKRFSLPWGCVIAGWIMLWVTVGLCTAFIVFYGIQFQDEKCRKWITSMLISFVTSIFLTQPIKVLLLALLFSLLFKKPDEEEEDVEDEEQIALENDELWLHSYNAGPTRQRQVHYEPPDPLMLERAREKRVKELKMYAIMREVIIYIFFLWIVIVISYDFRDPRAQQVKANLEMMFVDGGLGPNATANNSIDLMKSMDDFWGWMHNTFIPQQRAFNWYNGQRPTGLRGYLNDYVSRIMGFATMRQLRVKRGRCKVASQMRSQIHECNVPYSSRDEDYDDYNLGWIPRAPGDNSTVPSEYHYKQGSELDSYPFLTKHNLYSGGGYVVELRGDRPSIFQKVASLKAGGWVDRYTRAVFLEFSVYNVQANLFACVTIVAELLESSGFDAYYYVEPMNLLGDQSSGAMFTRACQIIYMGFIIFFIIREVRNIWKQRFGYFVQFWNWVELWIIAMSIGSVVIYVYRYFMTDELLKIFAKSGGNAYMKFQSVAYWNELMLYMIGLLVFWATMKFIKLLRFNKIMGLLGSTLRYASKSLVSFTLMFAILFFAFVQCFYLIYMASLETFSNVIFTAEECLQMMVGKFNFGEIVQASPILGTFMFFIYMIVVFFILLTMFVTIINEAFAAVRDDIRKQSNEHEMVDFVIGRFKQWTGISSLVAGFGKGKQDRLNNTKDLSHDPKVIEAQINNLPQRLDRFLDCISQVYFQHDNFESIITEHNATGKKLLKDNNLKAGMYGKAGGGSKYNPNLFPPSRGGSAIDRNMPNVSI